MVEAAIDRAAAAGVRVLLNLAPVAPLDPARLSRVDVLIANRGEADSLVPEADDALQQARLLAARHGLLAVVTLGADGAVAADDAGHAWRVVAPPVTAIDTVGAGDAFVGALAAALDCGRPMARALPRPVSRARTRAPSEGRKPAQRRIGLRPPSPTLMAMTWSR